MQTRDHYDSILVDAIKNSVRESFDERPPQVAVNQWIHCWLSKNFVQSEIDFKKKLLTEAGTLSLIPEKCPVHIGRGRWTDEDRYLPGAVTNSAEHVFPGDAAHACLLHFVEASVQFHSLGVREGDLFGSCGKALPQFLYEL